MRYKNHLVTTEESFSPSNGTIYYARIDGIQQIDYARGRGDFKTAEAAEEFAKHLIDINDFD